MRTPLATYRRPGRLLAAATCALLAASVGCDGGPHGEVPGPDARPSLPAPETAAQQDLDPRLLPAMDHAASGRPEQARAALDAYEQLPDALAYQAVFLRGFTDQRRKAYAAARAHFEAAIRLQPDYHPSWHFLGFACHALGDLPAARDAWEEHRRLAPGEGDDWFGLGLVAFEQDDLDAAERDFSEALRLFERDAADGKDRRRELGKTHARLADVHARRGDWPAARDALERSVGHFTGSDEVWHKLHQAHLRVGDETRAEQARAMRDRVRELQAGG